MEDIRYSGEIVWFDKQYGFISWSKDGAEQTDLFLHYSDLNIEGYKTVKKGQKVSFTIGKNNRGQDKATNVIVVE